jgi:hypothetical protein
MDSGDPDRRIAHGALVCRKGSRRERGQDIEQDDIEETSLEVPS